MGLTGYLFRKIFITNLFYDILYEYGILLINAFFLEPFTNLRTFCIELRAVRTSQKCSKIAASERSLVFGTEVRTTLLSKRIIHPVLLQIRRDFGFEISAPISASKK